MIEQAITMTRYYAAQRAFWVDPVSAPSSKKPNAPTTTSLVTSNQRVHVCRLHQATSTEETVESGQRGSRQARPAGTLWSRYRYIHRGRLGRAGQQWSVRVV